jgi:chromosome partitioning protein
MRIWALVSQKGGSGKSTLVTQLAAYAEQLGEVALVIDLDPQANACLWTQARGTKSPLVLAAAAEKLRELASTADGGGVTLVLIDTPSRVDDAALAAIQAADIVIAPTLAGLFDLGALADTVRLLRLAGKLEAAVAVINRVPQDRAAATVAHASAALERFEIAIAPVHVCDRPTFLSAIEAGKGVTERWPKGPAAAEIRALWAFLDKRPVPAPTQPRAATKRKARAAS